MATPYTESHQMFRKTVRDFCERELRPGKVEALAPCPYSRRRELEDNRRDRSGLRSDEVEPQRPYRPDLDAICESNVSLQACCTERLERERPAAERKLVREERGDHDIERVIAELHAVDLARQLEIALQGQ